MLARHVGPPPVAWHPPFVVQQVPLPQLQPAPLLEPEVLPEIEPLLEPELLPEVEPLLEPELLPEEPPPTHTPPEHVGVEPPHGANCVDCRQPVEPSEHSTGTLPWHDVPTAAQTLVQHCAEPALP